MFGKVNPTLLIVGAALLILIGLFFLVRQAAGPGETITDYDAVPPKGAGKFDKRPAAGL